MLRQLYLVVQGSMQLEHSSHIVKVDVEATCWRFKPWHILKDTTKPVGQFGIMPQEPWHPGKCTPIQFIKQLEHGRTSKTEEQNVPPFRQTMSNS